MAQTILIGFERSVGSFPNKTTGEVVEYSNRTLKLITDVGADESHIGYDSFEQKVKMSDLSRYLNVRDDDTSVDKALIDLIHKPVELSYAPRKGELAVVGFKAVVNQSNKTDK